MFDFLPTIVATGTFDSAFRHRLGIRLTRRLNDAAFSTYVTENPTKYLAQYLQGNT